MHRLSPLQKRKDVQRAHQGHLANWGSGRSAVKTKWGAKGRSALETPITRRFSAAVAPLVGRLSLPPSSRLCTQERGGDITSHFFRAGKSSPPSLRNPLFPSPTPQEIATRDRH